MMFFTWATASSYDEAKRRWPSMKKQLLVSVVSVLIGYGFFSGIPAYAEDGRFVAVEIGGVKFWLGGGDIDMRASARTPTPVTFKLTNKLDAEHGFAIDALGIKQVVKPGEEVTVTLPSFDVNNRDERVYRFYCHLHP